MWEYSAKVKDHFLHPRNVGVIEDADAVGEIGDITCGDALRLTLRIGQDERIEDVKFQTFGCGSAIASASALTELIKGKTLDEALRVTHEDIARYLDGLPEQKMHCSVMGRDALEAAVANYRGEPVAGKAEGTVVCKCFGVTDKHIERVIRENNLTTVEQVTNYSKAGGGCRSCHPEIEKILARVAHEHKGEVSLSDQYRKMTNVRKIKLIQDTIDREIRPGLRADGGDIELVDVEGDKVSVSLRGACRNCPNVGYTLKTIVEEKLHEFVSEDIEVVEVDQ